MRLVQQRRTLPASVFPGACNGPEGWMSGRGAARASRSLQRVSYHGATLGYAQNLPVPFTPLQLCPSGHSISLSQVAWHSPWRTP